MFIPGSRSPSREWKKGASARKLPAPRGLPPRRGGGGKALRERNILFCLDAIQTLGAFPTSAEHTDMLAADAHKWLLGPCGAGLMFVRREVQAELTPPIYGW